MSVADGTAGVPTGVLDGGPFLLDFLGGPVTLTGAYSVTRSHRPLLMLDPGGAGRTVTLPPEEHGLWYVIKNEADAAEAITLNDDAAGLVASIAQNEAVLVVSDGTSWFLPLGILTIALS